MIKNIVFDVGNVIVYWDSRRAFTGDYDEATIDQWYQEIDFDLRNDLADRGIGWGEQMQQLEKEGKVDQKWIDMGYHYEKNWKRTIWGQVPGTKELIDELKQKGYKVYLLSNWTKEFWTELGELIPFKNDLDGEVISSIEKQIKPEPEIYQTLLNRYQLKPEETVFADDRVKNIKAGQDLGIEGYVFDTADGFRGFLREKGVEV